MMNLAKGNLINSNDLDHLHEGSVKSIYQDSNNRLFFKFSDRYSIYDWGEMPDRLINKGKSLSYMTDLFFKYLTQTKKWANLENDKIYNTELFQGVLKSKTYSRLKENGLNHHSYGLRTNKEKEIFLEVEKVEKHPPIKIANNWQYTRYSEHPTDSLVPLEVIFRLGCPKGSSLIKRLKGNRSLMSELGINEAPKEGSLFNFPIVEFSTKLEPIDRYLNYSQATEIAGFSQNEFLGLKEVTTLLAMNINNLISKLGLKLWDGKFEFSFEGEYPNRTFKLVDSIGLDELRITLGDSFPLSKEFVRQCYIKSEWFKKITFCKKEYGDDWKKACIEGLKTTPDLLSQKDKEIAQFIYLAFTNALSKEINGTFIFDNKYTLSQLKEKIECSKEDVS